MLHAHRLQAALSSAVSGRQQVEGRGSSSAGGQGRVCQLQGWWTGQTLWFKMDCLQAAAHGSAVSGWQTHWWRAAVLVDGACMVV